MNVFFESLLSSTVALAAIGFICKFFLNYFDKRGLETFKQKMLIEKTIIEKRIELNIDRKNMTIKELGRWSNTLLSATNGLIGRLSHIKDSNNLNIDSYMLDSTKYYLCQYLCWEQIFRNERNTSILSPVNDEILISQFLKNVSITLRENTSNHPTLRSLEQKYIGEKMIKGERCLPYNEFLTTKPFENFVPLETFINSILIKQDIDFIKEIISRLKELQAHVGNVLKNAHCN
ncbi:hypothetical protein [Serratia liquefaciens]|uniref:Uncharacterized protein n=1 Tax=Serratia liquefaciens TaxID=614 RepID=A0A515CR07_SERLI|nr:hypothetical protein [Serratia liquefaciens]QDL30604.1 hypothetical protein EGO53_01810 [Serratia liquefaciens]